MENINDKRRARVLIRTSSQTRQDTDPLCLDLLESVRIILLFIDRLDRDMNDFRFLSLGWHEPAPADGSDVRSLILLPGQQWHLQRPDNGHQPREPPCKRGKVELDADAVQQARNRAGEGATRGAGAGGQAVDLAQMGRVGRGLFDEDEEQRVGEDGEEVAQGEAGVDGGVHVLGGQAGEEGDDEVRRGMADGDADEELPHAQPGGHEREDDGLHEQRDDAVDAHDQADLLGRQAQAARGSSGEGGGHDVDALVLQEDGEEMVIAHGVVCEDAESGDEHEHGLAEDGGLGV